MNITEKIDKYLNEGNSVTSERKGEAEKYVKNNYKTKNKIDSVDKNGIYHGDGEFVSWKQASELAKKGNLNKNLKSIIKMGTNLYIIKYNELPPE